MLSNVLCLPDSHDGLCFISQLPALQTLQLHNVSPSLHMIYMYACTGLVSLTLQGDSDTEVFDLDLTPLASLQELHVIDYGLWFLCVSGLTALCVLDCSNNRIGKLDLSTCTALRVLR